MTDEEQTTDTDTDTKEQESPGSDAEEEEEQGLPEDLRVTDDELERRMYSHDLAPLPKEIDLLFETMPDFVVKPRNETEISEIVQMANRRKMPVIARGGGSWGYGGAMPIKAGIVLDISVMNKVIEIDEDNLTVTCEAGITWERLIDELDKKGYFLGAYPSSAASATVGGWINTGGVGIGSYKYGGAGVMLRSMEVVLPNGKVVETGFKNVSNHASGYDLNWLFVGSEGTLGIVTKATLKIYPKPEELRPLTYSFDDMKALAKAAQEVTHTRIIPYHMAFADGEHFELLRRIGKEVPKVGALLNIVLEGDTTVVDHEAGVIHEIMERNGAKKEADAVAKHEWEERFYEYRVRKIGVGATPAEAIVPLTKLGEVAEATRRIIDDMKFQGAILGYITDINSAFMMPYYITTEKKLVKSMAALGFAKSFGDLAFEHGGRPYGLGLFFASNLKKLHGASGATLSEDIKKALDPNNIINPGKTVEVGTGLGFSMPKKIMRMMLVLMGGLKRILPQDSFEGL